MAESVRLGKTVNRIISTGFSGPNTIATAIANIGARYRNRPDRPWQDAPQVYHKATWIGNVV